MVIRRYNDERIHFVDVRTQRTRVYAHDMNHLVSKVSFIAFGDPAQWPAQPAQSCCL